MAKKIQKLKPDTVLKSYWSDNEQFADLFNAVLFDGESVIKADELEDAGTEESTVLEKKEYAESIQASRDVIKIQKKSKTLGVEFVMYGLENQERIHYAMPMRVMGLVQRILSNWQFDLPIFLIALLPKPRRSHRYACVCEVALSEKYSASNYPKLNIRCT